MTGLDDGVGGVSGEGGGSYWGVIVRGLSVIQLTHLPFD